MPCISARYSDSSSSAAVKSPKLRSVVKSWCWSCTTRCFFNLYDSSKMDKFPSTNSLYEASSSLITCSCFCFADSASANIPFNASTPFVPLLEASFNARCSASTSLPARFKSKRAFATRWTFSACVTAATTRCCSRETPMSANSRFSTCNCCSVDGVCSDRSSKSWRAARRSTWCGRESLHQLFHEVWR